MHFSNSPIPFLRPGGALAASLFITLVSLPAGEQPLTAASAVRLALTHNPEMIAARQLIREAEARTRESGRLQNPELEAEIAGGQDSEGRLSVGITQRFPLTARLRLERNLSALAVHSARLEVRERERQLALAAREAHIELAAARDARAILQRQSQAAAEFAATLRQGARQGFTSPLETGEADIEAKALAASEASQQVAETEAAARLAGLTGLPFATRFSLPAPPPFPDHPPAPRPPGERPDLALAVLAVEAGRTGVSLARASRWDDVGVGVFVEGERFRDEPEGIEPEALIGLRLSIPLPVWQNGAGEVAEKEAARRRSEAQHEALRRNVTREVASTHRIMSIRHAAAANLRGTLLPEARRQVAEAEAAAARAEAPVQAVFRSRERLTRLELDTLQAVKNFHLAHAAWLTALGASSAP